MSQTKSQTLTQKFLSLSQLYHGEDETGILLAAPLQKSGQNLQLFRGQARQPLLFRDNLIWLSEIVNARFYRPDLWRYLDPVVSCESQQIRLECFSSCASVYGRIDLDSDFFNGYALHQRGTTNVNFNPAFIQSLSLLRPGQRTVLEVGSKSLTLSTPDNSVTEEKVSLPERWVKGFLQSQALFRRAKLWQALPALAARQFLIQVKASEESERWLYMRGKQLCILPVKPAGGADQNGLSVAGLHRLGLLRKLIPHIQGLEIYASPQGGPTLWVALLPQSRATLALSSSVKHGFSGEGEALRNLSGSPVEAEADFLRDLISNFESFDVSELSQSVAKPESEVLASIDTLASEGLLGYDNHQARYFYRPLPFVETQQARLSNAHTLLNAGQVELEHLQALPGGLMASGWVRGEAEYRVELAVQGGYLSQADCTCPWIQTHHLKRGPCKHLLALRFSAEKQLETKQQDSQSTGESHVSPLA
jgi:predicted transcriptional regulator